ncbi:tRNA (adenosine(37)-N6)-threonylcarbamoyltransferase complex transferase subunit TsaD [Patescibacteria group bacterium]|nr:tRNA (adenosine(37)-N6)-threonylcarbamoyltransferase complex transferase subunit TsaD [Patescibacteria group bacterium]MBU4017426.1 tRNA (adenosine(37)-N6)-threonylcarbamoyltransferase complex transferase subunit TsaD [Patescibacteria group bacterium]MBU4098416.1 tRNA (adenosine(37)-N6)-threonylcarbamoyltransferase complex transferase subunit TsaD [Patescibacteria group bacterium]
MIILGIETSCDETSVAVVEGKGNEVILKANIVVSSLSMHAKTGGIIPEVAARAQLKFMLPVLREALEKAAKPPIDAIAVTYGPGLIGPLLIGLETARTLSFTWQKPLIPVNHMLGHVYANFIRENPKSEIRNPNKSLPKFPLIALVASGGHTDLLYIEKHGCIRILGGTRDDAAGEAFDKIGRLLGLSYPAGAVIEQRARRGNAKRFRFPRPLSGIETYDFSFSGLKTAVLREVLALRHPERREESLNHAVSLSNPLFQKNPACARNSSAKPQNDTKLDEQTINDIAAGTQAAVVDVLVKKTLKAVGDFHVNSIVLSGGVSSNQSLRQTLQAEMQRQNIGAKLFFPPKNLCTDNAAMIAAASYFNYNPVNWRKLSANPELYYE